MSDAVATELEALKKRRQAEYLAKGSNEIPPWVFCNREGNPLDYYNLKHRHFEKCLQHAGPSPHSVSRFKAHVLDIVTNAGRIARLREGATRTLEHQSHGRYLRALDTWSESTSGESAPMRHFTCSGDD